MVGISIFSVPLPSLQCIQSPNDLLDAAVEAKGGTGYTVSTLLISDVN